MPAEEGIVCKSSGFIPRTCCKISFKNHRKSLPCPTRSCFDKIPKAVFLNFSGHFSTNLEDKDMKAIAVVPGTKQMNLVDRLEPAVEEPDEIKVRILRVGICGTDREEAAGGRSKAVEGSSDLVIGHEMLGQVVDAGASVTRVKPGDIAVFTVRRGCGECVPCLMNRSDMCLSGNYRERGIWGRDGYQCEYVVDKEQYVVQLPPELEPIAVLTEPMSVCEKAIDESIRIQTSRLPDAGSSPDWLFGKKCLIAGLGPIGLLAGIALVLRGANVYGLDIVAEDSSRPQWFKTIGGKYIDGRKIPAEQIDERIGYMDMIFEATGIASLEYNLLDVLAIDGVYVLTGIPGGDRPLEITGSKLIRQLVLKNQVMIGSVNAARGHFQLAVNDLIQAYLRWGTHMEKLITHRHRFTDFSTALTQHPQDEIKVVIEWSRADNAS
jgi:threonine dehydrogenase-like Zn-dependent dehydrogenase